MKSFESLKQNLLSEPILSIYNSKYETELHTDASKLGFGAILMQKQDDGYFHPVFYFSKRASPDEEKLHSFELEILAVIYALESFRVYLHGIHFKIVTDCKAFTLTIQRKDTSPKIHRWT